MKPCWASPNGMATLYHGDAVAVMRALEAESVDVIFADPPYFLGEHGSTCKSGNRASVSKGRWDRGAGFTENHRFNGRWLREARRVLHRNGSIWVTGTTHNIHSVAVAMAQLGYRVINNVVWEKPNPPPNLGCRCLTHSHESMIWAARSHDSRYHFDYEAMKRIHDVQLKDVWRGPAPNKSEKTGHPTQKPLWLVARCLRAAAPQGATILDPFNGSGTTGEAAIGLPHDGWRFIGIDEDESYLEITRKRLLAQLPRGTSE